MTAFSIKMLTTGPQSPSGLAFIQLFHFLHIPAHDQQTTQFHFLFLLDSGQSPRQGQLGCKEPWRNSTRVFKRCGNIALGCTRASPGARLYNPEEKLHCSVFDLPPSWLSKAPVPFPKLQRSADILTTSIPGISVPGDWRSQELDPLNSLSYRVTTITEVRENTA